MVAAAWEEWARHPALAAQTFPSIPILVGASPPSGAWGKRRRDLFPSPQPELCLGPEFLWLLPHQTQGGQEGGAAPGPRPEERKVTPDA